MVRRGPRLDERDLRERPARGLARPGPGGRRGARGQDRVGAPAMRVTAAAATDIGRVREGNEDSYLTEGPLFAVADGMGGHRGGEVASQLAVTTIAESFRKGAVPFAEQVQAANRAVFERSGADRAVAGMGTTLTAAVIQGDLAHLVHRSEE